MAFMCHHPVKKQMIFPAASQRPKQPSARFNAPGLYACAALLAMSAQAQTTEPAAAQPTQGASQVQAAQPVSPAPATAPKYAARDIERAFSFIDTNKDGKISREEAAGFRGVAKHFDEADINKDGMLSREEFENALNGNKPQ